ncbi:hypothetical protein CL653_02280 [bacterium]|nr:hypothetical protein [bacterium]
MHALNHRGFSRSLTFFIPMYILWYMNTHTILNIKTDKDLKVEAQSVAKELGLPLSTVINAFLRQFVRDKEVTFSADTHRPTPYLEGILKTAQAEFAGGDYTGPLSGDELLQELRTL